MAFVEVHCPSCGRYFRQAPSRLCEGEVLSCPHCEQSWALSYSSPFYESQRLLQVARQMRLALGEPRPASLETFPRRTA